MQTVNESLNDKFIKGQDVLLHNKNYLVLQPGSIELLTSTTFSLLSVSNTLLCECLFSNNLDM